MGNQKIKDYSEAIELISRGKIENVDESLFSNKEFILEYVKREDDIATILKYSSDKIKTDKDFLLQLMQQSIDHGDSERPGILSLLNEELKNDRDFVKKAVELCGEDLMYLNDEFKNDSDIVLTAVENEQFFDEPVFSNASDELKSNKEVVLKAVKSDGESLRYVSEELKGDKEVVLEAVFHMGGELFEEASDDLKTDKDFIAEIIEAGGANAFEYISDELKSDKDFVLKVLPLDYNNIFLNLPDSLKNDKEIALMVLNNDDRYANYVGEELKNDEDIIPFLVSSDSWWKSNEELEAQIKQNEETIQRNQKEIDSARQSLIAKLIEQQKTIRQQELQIANLRGEKSK